VCRRAIVLNRRLRKHKNSTTLEPAPYHTARRNADDAKGMGSQSTISAGVMDGAEYTEQIGQRPIGCRHATAADSLFVADAVRHRREHPIVVPSRCESTEADKKVEDNLQQAPAEEKSKDNGEQAASGRAETLSESVANHVSNTWTCSNVPNYQPFAGSLLYSAINGTSSAIMGMGSLAGTTPSLSG